MINQMHYRTESDSIGSKAVPSDALYGVQALRAKENFPITGLSLDPLMIQSLAELKKACAIANKHAKDLDAEKADAIIFACDEILAGKYHDQFIVDPIQGGAGTSMNMNANEVIANIAIKKLGGQPGDYSLIHPNDHVNCGQSTNDIIPTAGKMTTIKLLRQLYTSMCILCDALRDKASEFDGILKMGRTQLEDAVPIRLGQEFSAWRTAVLRSLDRLQKAEKELHTINMGGTAIGTGITANEEYFEHICSTLSSITGEQFSQAGDLIDATQNIDCFASISSAIKNCALVLSKISNDLRLMSSGPKTGFSEINLPAKQNGSSIMPGKINPVIPEVVNQIAFRIVGNDVTIAMAVEAGQLELNAFEPVVFYSLFQSIELLKNGIDTLVVNCIRGITANKRRCNELLDSSVGVVTALSPYLGYTCAAKLAKESLKTNVPVRELAVQHGYFSSKQIESILTPERLTNPGVLELNAMS